jgi:hypothetical protein
MKYGITTIAVLLAGFGLNADAKAQGISDVQLVQSWYARYLHREPDRCGLESWVRQLRTGSPPECIEAAFLSSDEYYDIHERCPRGFVRGMYADVLGRGASPDEVEGWVCRLRRECRKDVAKEFLCAARRELASRVVVPASYVPTAPPVAAPVLPYPEPVVDVPAGVSIRIRIGR